jgi:hypothetical protein
VAWAISAPDHERVVSLLTTLGMEALFASRVGSVMASLAETAIDLAGIDEHRRYPSLVALSAYALHQRRDPRALERASRAVELLEIAEVDYQPLVYSFHLLLSSQRGDTTQLRLMAELLVKLARENGDLFEIGYALNGFAGVESYLRMAGQRAEQFQIQPVDPRVELTEARLIGERLQSQRLLAACAQTELLLLLQETEPDSVVAAADNARRLNYAMRVRFPATTAAGVYDSVTHSCDDLARSIYRWALQESADELDHASLVIALEYFALSLGATGHLEAGAQLHGFALPRLPALPGNRTITAIALGSARAEFERLAQTSTLATIDEATALALSQLDMLRQGSH